MRQTVCPVIPTKLRSRRGPSAVRKLSGWNRTPGNGQVRFRSAQRPNLCINVAGAPGTPDNQQLIVWPCDNDTNERFVFTPFDPTGSPAPDPTS